MRISGRILGAFFLVLSAGGIVGCAAGVIAIWIGRPAVAQRVEQINARLAAGIQRASAATRDVERALQKARADVGRVGKESAGLGNDPVKDRLTGDILRKLIDRQVGPNVNELGGRLATLSDAVVAAASLLRSFEELPLGPASRIDPEKLGRATEQASQLSAALQRLQSTIGEGDKIASEREVAAAANNIDLVLQRCQVTVDDWRSYLDAAREQRAH
ncbi:MAG TPA: hypothetical protein VKE94_18525, partial [Gemmataceae bacterium]|nr:hypothetical protein [Gemmataceae bacterium]